MNPFYKTATFWVTVVSAIAAVLGGIVTQQEVALFTGAAGIIIAYLVQKGIVERAAIQAVAEYNDGWNAGHEFGLEQAKREAELVQGKAE